MKPGRPVQHRRPGLAALVLHAQQQRRQLGEELAVLLGHVLAHHRVADGFEPVAHAGALLQLPVRRRGSVDVSIQAAAGNGERGMPTKPGRASTRCSQARSRGQGSSAMPPSGACAV